ncbi:MAG: DNA translocase FtsK [Chloroflexi bacterium]|nr:DNA translocase FtsK [Chloroflexota bacterium]
MTAPRRSGRSTAKSTAKATTTRSSSRSRRRPTYTAPSVDVAPEVVRSIVGIVLMVLGAILLIGIILPGKGVLTDWIRDIFAPWFGTGRLLLPFLLLALGIYVERVGKRAGWGWTLAGVALAFVGLLGMLAVIVDMGFLEGRSGGRIGSFISETLGPLVTQPGALVISTAILVIGILIALNATLGSLLRPMWEAARTTGGVLLAPRPPAEPAANGKADAGRNGAAAADARATQAGKAARDVNGRPDVPMPVPAPAPAPVSAVFGPGPEATTVLAAGGAAAGAGSREGARDADALASVADLDPDAVTEAGDAPRPREHRAYALPPVSLLDDVAVRSTDAGMDHARNAQIIEAKLASFNIPVAVSGWNAGPVVTQYEVTPDPSVKVSRIEALSDDLAMALAARTIRIEAPIPGKTVVGIEIPNMDFNVVGLRRILEDPDVMKAPSKLAFALGRDVAGHARAADLAKMPHLLIAGATGSGKSVMVNALITSLLVRGTPDEVRLILVDPKRVELADYNGVPHLLVPVITEASRAKAALIWCTREMENRYRKFAGAAARNIVAYNETREDPADRLPYIVIVVDELADLMMRDGRSTEEPIVMLAQKARATGIHLVLATQRPSVNVVTGLIKANFPSRIAFAMASQIDSRTILDAPGAEDLIGRGDMLFQPSDLPRPIRLQGVFVSDREIRGVTAHWRAEAEPHYDLSIVETDEDSTARVEDVEDDETDRLFGDAVQVIQEYDRASASLLQRRLKIGYARAARIIDQLEAHGYIGPFDGSNARQVLRREVPGARGGGDPDEDEL